MSTILHRRTTEVSVAIPAREAGVEFANASADVQVEFFAGMVEAIAKWPAATPWPMQCRFIVDEMSQEARHELAWRLDTLMEHLREPVGT